MTTATTAPKNPRNLFEEQRPARTGHQPDEELDDEESKDGVLAVGQPRIAVSGPVLVYQGQGRKDQLRRQVQAARNTMVTITITITITITLTIMITNPLTLPAVVRCGTLHQLSPPLTVMGKVCLLVGCLTSQCISGTDLLLTILRAVTLRQRLQIQLSTSPSHSILTPGQPVPALTLQRQAPGRLATGVPILKSLV